MSRGIMSEEDNTDASMDPWCLIRLAGGDVLLGYAARHPATGGLSWVRSTPVVEINELARWARTESGRRYRLGRGIALAELPRVSDEGWIAYLLLVARAEGMLADSDGSFFETAASWLAACKAARWLKVHPPRRNRSEVDAWWAEHLEVYVAVREASEHKSLNG
jgi:hypothetical protein